jgi:hypothetical protein
MIVLATTRLRKDGASKRCDIIFAIHASKYETDIIKMLNNVNESTFKLTLCPSQKHHSQPERMYNSPYNLHGENSG